jgi:excreted virulence factor EspC (type VII ESX diderm)
MGERPAASVDIAALAGVAHQFEIAADIVDNAVRQHLSGLAFNGATAGRTHVGRGDALRAAVDHIGDQLHEWSRASAEIAAILRTSALRYADADARAADRVG